MAPCPKQNEERRKKEKEKKKVTDTFPSGCNKVATLSAFVPDITIIDPRDNHADN